jgi:branched-chain amino acid transport system substrate-binding protein
VLTDDGQAGAMLARYAVKNMNAKTVAVIDDRTAYGQGLADEFIKEIKKNTPNVKVAQRHYTNPNASDFNGILTAIKAVKPDVIFYGGNDAVAGPMLRQMQALNIQASMVAGDGVCTDKMNGLAGGALKDGKVICAEAGGVTTENKKRFDDFFVAYKKRFGVPVQIYAPYVYDSVMVLAKAMQQAQSSDPVVYLPYLQKIRYKGITGLISFDAKGNIQNGTITLYTYRAGQRLPLMTMQ